jgi:hypothetical protein
MPTVATPLVVGLLFAFIYVSPALAQNYSTDARAIGLGAVGSTRNIASSMTPKQNRYRRIGIPLGLLQVLRDTRMFFPKDENDDDKIDEGFDLFRSMEYAASPLNYTFGRDETGSGEALVNDVISDELNRDLNAYRGFRPATRLTAEGLGAPNWGKTFKMRSSPDEGAAYHGIYVGAGPYLTVTTDTETSTQLADLLGSPTPVYLPNTSMGVNHFTEFQAAAAITGGYRYFRPRPSTTTIPDRQEGFYLASNVNYLLGLHYDSVGLDINFNTDAAGLVRPDAGPDEDPLTMRLLRSTTGRGVAVDVGAIYLVGRWDMGVGLNGIGNRIKWTDVELREYIEQNLEGGDEADTTDPVPAPDFTLELPLNSSLNVAYHADKWLGVAEYSRRFRGNNFQGGLEYLMGNVAVRGGGRYARDRWHPSAGVGMNLTDTFGIDVAVFSTSTNLERRRHAAIAISLRFDKLAGGGTGITRGGARGGAVAD